MYFIEFKKDKEKYVTVATERQMFWLLFADIEIIKIEKIENFMEVEDLIPVSKNDDLEFGILP